MSEVKRIENIAQYTLEFIGNDLILTLKKTPKTTPVNEVSQPIIKLYLSYQQLTTLRDNLPQSLQQLYCSNNQITALPDNLPQSLQELYCSSNKLTTLPDILPQSLQQLYCSNNQITALPGILPQSLEILYCYNNQLTTLPGNLPQRLRELACSSNQLTILPNLPQSLTCIDLKKNPLEANYPLIFTFNKTKDIVAYVNQRNTEMLADAKKQIEAAQALIARFEK